jgi:hypothetical protein
MIRTAFLRGNNQVKDGARASMGAGTPARRTRTVWGLVTATALALMLAFGPARAEAEQTTVTVVTFAGHVQSIQGDSVKYVFAGPTATVTVAKNDRLTGAASAPMGLTLGSQAAAVGLCS